MSNDIIDIHAQPQKYSCKKRFTVHWHQPVDECERCSLKQEGKQIYLCDVMLDATFQMTYTGMLFDEIYQKENISRFNKTVSVLICKDTI